MPFTPSHAVLALPFIRTPLVPAAVAVGAMTPDLPLFVRGTPLTYATTHSWPGLALTLLVAFVLLLAWRCVLRPAIRELSPAWLATRLPQEWDLPARDAALDAVGAGPRYPRGRGYPLLLVASLLIGVVSHIVWDAFTHEGRWGLALIPALDESWGPLLGYKWMQYASGVVGLVIIAIWAALWLGRRAERDVVSRVLPEAVRVAWWASLPVVLVVAWAAGLIAYGPLDASFGVAHLAYRVLPPACAVWGVGTLVLAVLVQAVRGRRSGRRDQPAPASTSARRG